MTKIERPNAGLLLCVSALALLSAKVAHAESWLAFGDSLTDTGNAYTLTGGAIPDPDFYAGGRFSNGPVWFDQIAGDHGLLADHLMGNADPAQRNWNFAVGGATSGDDPLDPATGIPPGLRTQVDMARSLIDAGAIRGGSDTTAVLWAGANDHGIWLTHPGRDAALDGIMADAVADNIDAATRGIVEAGVGRVAVLNLFDFSLAPTTALLPEDIRAAGDAMVARHNSALLRQAEAADAETDAQVLLVDVHALFDEIAHDPSAWGFESLAPCLPDGGAPDCTAPGSADRRVFWDGTHLTSAAQELVAGMVKGTLSAGHDLPYLSGETTALSFALTERHLRDARRRAADGTTGGWMEATRFDLSVGRQAGAFSGLAGGWVQAEGSLTWGASLAWSEGETSAGRTDIDADGWTASAFVRQEFGALGLTGQIGWGRMSLDVTRDTVFAPAARAAGQTDARTRVLDLGTDWRFSAGSASVVIDGGLTWADTQRDGYAETGGGLMSATLAGQSVETLSMRLGATAAMDLGLASLPVTTFARMSWQDVLRSRVSGGGVELGSGQRIAGHALSGIVEGTEVELGISGRIGKDFTVRASWTVLPFDDGLADGNLALGAGIRF